MNGAEDAHALCLVCTQIHIFGTAGLRCAAHLAEKSAGAASAQMACSKWLMGWQARTAVPPAMKVLTAHAAVSMLASKHGCKQSRSMQRGPSAPSAQAYVCMATVSPHGQHGEIEHVCQ